MMVGPMIKNPSTRNASQLTHTKNNSSARKISIILSHYPNFFVKVSSNSRLELYYISTWVFECPKGHIWHLPSTTLQHCFCVQASRDKRV